MLLPLAGVCANAATHWGYAVCIDDLCLIRLAGITDARAALIGTPLGLAAKYLHLAGEDDGNNNKN
jgi:hypothetical protein